MKNSPFIFLVLVGIMLVTAGCGNNSVVPMEPTNATIVETIANQPAEETAKPIGEAATPTVKPTTYKESMLPFDQLEAGPRIVILQNALHYTRDGFYSAETKPVTKEIVYDGNNVAAYSMSYALAFLHKGSAGTVKVINNDGSEQELNAENFAGLFVIIDFSSDAAPVLYNPESGTKITDFLLAITSEGEAIYSVVSGVTIIAAELIGKAGFDTEATYRYVASDKFYIPVAAADNLTGEVRGTLSGAVNGSFPNLKIASGKINDVIYIELMS